MNTPVIQQILERARWAPSGDNTQCWQFEIVSGDHLVIHGFDTRHDCVYDLDGHPSQISFGALIETVAIAASVHGLRADAVRRDLPDSEAARPIFDVRLAPDAKLAPSPLAPFIETRSVQRRPMGARRLTGAEKAALEAAAGPDFAIAWFETFPERWRAARLMFNNAKLRLTMPEAYEVHRRIIDWANPTHSPAGVPPKALGVDPGTLKLMKWAMGSWGRLSVMNALMGTWAPRLQMDLVPGLACAAHFVLKAKRKPATIDDYVAAGRAVQRFWLTVTRLGLAMQPEMTPLIFSKYMREQTVFTRVTALRERAGRLQRETEALIFTDGDAPVYMGRVGAGPAPTSRSLRKDLKDLMKPGSQPLA